jgi:L-fuculose-phosphate aldolase
MSDLNLERRIRRAIVEVYGELARLGMNTGSTGNVSVRVADGMLITPTGCTEESLRPGDIVRTHFDGASEGPLKPSSEWIMHAMVYGRLSEARAIVHTHADHCVALSCLRKPIPAFHYMVQHLGGAIRCTAYHPFGTAELGHAAADALDGRNACLMANHGMLTRGTSLRAAFDAAVLVETLARQYAAILAIGKPVLLNKTEMKLVARQFEDYGKQPRAKSKQRWMVP